jgi:hypothetical protein
MLHKFLDAGAFRVVFSGSRGPENAAIEAAKRSCADVMQHQGLFYIAS